VTVRRLGAMHAAAMLLRANLEGHDRPEWPADASRTPD
jgi:hypothetical protein